MNAGDLRHRVTIERPIRMESAQSGEVLITWERVRDARAAIRPLSAREAVLYRQVQMLGTHEVRMRYADDVTADCRLDFNGRKFYLVGPPLNVDELKVEMRLTVVERTN
jgi:SPP1 family predicted phage head-tail adaptor